MEFAEQIVIVPCGTGWRSHCVGLADSAWSEAGLIWVKGMTGDSRDLPSAVTGRSREQLEGIKKMTKSINADAILERAEPLMHQHALESQPYGHIIRMPIALSQNACKESVENLNQLLADTITLRDLYQSTTGRLPDRRSINCTCYSTNTTTSRASSLMRSPNAFNCWAASASRWRQTLLR